MIRKDFQLIADALRASKPYAGVSEEAAMNKWNEIVVRLASVLATTNIHFDRARFLDACGYDDNKE